MRPALCEGQEIMSKIKSFESLMGKENFLRVHVIFGQREAILVDTAMRGYEHLVEEALAFLRSQQMSLTWIVNTHAHHDHIGLNYLVQHQTGARIVSHPWGKRWLADPDINYREFVLGYPGVIKDTPALRHEVYDTLGEGTSLDIGVIGGEHVYLDGATDIEIVDTSGHVAGEIGLLVIDEQTLILGDALVGLTLPMFHGYVDPLRYRETLQRIRDLVVTGRVCRLLSSHLPLFQDPDEILHAVSLRVNEMEEIHQLVLERIGQQPSTLRDIWLSVSKVKNKQAEFRGLAMVAGHIAHLQFERRVAEENGTYRLLDS
ncbi:MAG TPA: hypothetical protein DD856_16135 [Sulfobacillus sp.]|nr:hypothetical protein [Sulfobacillus sp.]